MKIRGETDIYKLVKIIDACSVKLKLYMLENNVLEVLKENITNKGITH